MRVMIVDDHQMFAESLGRLLETRDHNDVQYSSSVAGAGEVARAHPPDVAIVDWNLPDGNGGAVIRSIRRVAPATKVLVLTGSSSPRVVHDALDAGADGFLTKDRAAQELFEAIDTVHRGEVSLSPDALHEVLRSRSDAAGTAELSARELEILHGIARGLSNKEIATELFLSANTVRNHVQRLSSKLGAHSRLEAVVLAVRAGLITLPSTTA